MSVEDIKGGVLIMYEECLREFGRRVQITRDRAGLSQDKLAKALGYTNRAMICQMEKGKFNPPLSVIIDMAKVLKAAPAYLAFGDARESELSEKTKRLLTFFGGLSDLGQDMVVEYTALLSDSPKYRSKQTKQ